MTEQILVFLPGFILLILPLLSLSLSWAGLRKIKRTNQAGRGLAIAGCTIGGFGCGLLLLWAMIWFLDEPGRLWFIGPVIIPLGLLWGGWFKIRRMKRAGRD